MENMLKINVFGKILFNFLYRTKLNRKLIITYIIIIIIPIFVLGIFLTRSLYEAAFADKIKSSNTTVRQIGENIASTLSTQTRTIRSLISDTSFMSYLDTYYEDDFQSFSDYMQRVGPIIARLSTDSNDSIIRVFSQNGTIGFSGEMNNKVENLINEKWYKKPEQRSETIFWTGLCNLSSFNTNKYIGCYRTLYDFSRGEEIHAVISVFLNESILYSLISEEKSGGNIVFLLDPSGKVVTTTERALIQKVSNQILLNGKESILSVKSGTIVKYNEANYLFSIAEINKESENINGWKVAYLTPADRMLIEIKEIWINSILLSVLCIIVSLLIITSVSASVNNRISNLIGQIKKVFNGDLNVYLQVDGSDEISTLQDDFNTMVEKLDNLIHEVYESKIKQQEEKITWQKIEIGRRRAEIKALQRQINPHYLINTLESMRMNLVLGGDTGNAGIIKKLADSFRVMVYGNSRLHSIEAEINFIRMYMDIQKYRFGDRIKIEYHVSQELAGKYIPKLIIQPLVENAVCHGIEMKDGGGSIDVNVSKQEDAICITVSDDGVGMSRRKLNQIIGKLNNDAVDESDDASTMSVALANIHHRIRLEFGDEYGLVLSSAKGKGTTVRMLIPLNLTNI